MNYEIIQPENVKHAAEIIRDAIRVISGQLEFAEGKRAKAWNGDFVAHMKREAQNAIDWLLSHPKG